MWRCFCPCSTLFSKEEPVPSGHGPPPVKGEATLKAHELSASIDKLSGLPAAPTTPLDGAKPAAVDSSPAVLQPQQAAQQVAKAAEKEMEGMTSTRLLKHGTSGLSGTDPGTDGFLHANLRVDFEDLTFHELIGKGSTKSV
ncbi:hypothetical protein DUNSADRAFT_16561 [Dunaliella salina]|uniref:Encoded protein n=1 Tax=Dunaliella salina TaxID=3046 RepID=A0ABQ7H0V4_DUNSA|nr:hypothetical protein DUNSADRAFT_16561 [Dunaliella salina]|eukprot:KAF5840470.1 hypothetical protein DUNSADRAFT_16561 [Dunaliella salina]